MKKIILFLITIISFQVKAQQLYFALPVEVTTNNTFGNYHPRITLANGIPVVTWGETDAVYTSHYMGGTFIPPVQISPAGSDLFINVVDGPAIASKGDTVYYTYYDQTGSNESIILARSFDAGASIADTQVAFSSTTKRVEFPEITVLENGRIVLSFIRSELDETLPEIVVAYSDDNGLTFTSPVNVSAVNPGQPCECCPMSIISKGNFVAVGYRNNISNTRDFYVSTSSDFGTSFTNGSQIDFSNWSVASCPTTGIDFLIQDDTLIGAFTTKPGTIFQGKVGTMHIGTLTAGQNRLIDETPSNFIQNYPSIAGNDDTLAIVWQDNRNGSADIYISWSLNGASQLSTPEKVNLTINTGTQQGAHIVFENGMFHIVWMDSPSGKVYYQRAKFSPFTGVNEVSFDNRVIVYPNPSKGIVHLESSLEIKNYDIYTTEGRLVYSATCDGKTITHRLIAGEYILKLYSKDGMITKKLLVEK